MNFQNNDYISHNTISTINEINNSQNTNSSNKAVQTVRYRCQKCDSHFTAKYLLYHHETIHNIKFTCPFCPCLFSNKNDFRKHVIAHDDVKFSPCCYCNKVFYDIMEYESHIKSHSEKPLMNCKICPAKFWQTSALRKHMLVHMKRKFIHVITENILHPQCEKKIKEEQSEKKTKIGYSKPLKECRNNSETDANSSNIRASGT